MSQKRALFWLGQPDQGNTVIAHAATCEAALHCLEVCSQARSRLAVQSDRQLIDDTIRLFDAALECFDKDTSHQARRVIDLVALSVVNRIRQYLSQMSALESASKPCTLEPEIGCPFQVCGGDSGRSEQPLGPGADLDADT